MGELKGLVKFRGKVGDLIAYQLNGKWGVRKKSGPTKKQIKTQANFKRVRENNNEFGGASTISKYLRNLWMPFTNKDKDATLNNRLTSLIISFIKIGEGSKGKRHFKWINIAPNFDGFNINKAQSVTHYLSGLPKIDCVANTLNWSFQNVHIVKPSKGTTHAKVFLLLNALPHFQYDQTTKKYQPSFSDISSLLSESQIMPIETAFSDADTMNLQSGVAYAVTVGIQFFQQKNGENYPLAEHPLQWIKISVPE